VKREGVEGEGRADAASSGIPAIIAGTRRVRNGVETSVSLALAAGDA